MTDMTNQANWKLSIHGHRASPIGEDLTLHRVTLSCGGCGNPCLHATRTDVYDREEDVETGRHVAIIRDKMVSIDQNIKRNPSPRREGLSISFECELCSYITQLHVLQHKGAVFLVSE